MKYLNKLYHTLLLLFVGVASLYAQAGEAGEAAEELQEFYAGADYIDYANPKRYRVRDIHVHGAPSMDHEILISSAGLIKGDTIFLPSDFVSSVISRLWAQKRYSDVRMGAVIDGDDVELDIYLQERPRVASWNFTGISNSKVTDLKDNLKLRANGELSDYVLDKATRHIKAYFEEKGFRNADVKVRVEDDSLRVNMVNVSFDIDQKQRVKIQEIVFEGNEAFEDKRLRAALKQTHQRNINFFQSKRFEAEKFEEDKLTLLDFYNSKGYRNAHIVSDSIYDISENRLGVKITVSEGNQYFIRDVKWVGNSVYETKQLEDLFGVRKGDTYDKKAINKRLGMGKDANPDDMSILSLYQNNGYLMSQIDPAEIIIGADSIDLELKIFEGNQFTINEVTISGNSRVDDEVIRRELYTRPGELYNRALLMQTIRTLGNMGHFNAESIMPDIQPVSNETVNIGWPLEEQASDQFNISGGWGSGTFVGSVGITLTNLSAKNLFNKGAWRPYPMGQNQKLAISAQTNGTYYKAFSLSFTDPWLGGKKPNSFTLGAHYSDQNDAYYVFGETSQYFRTMGISAGLGKRLTWPDPYFSIYFEVGYERYMLNDWDSFIMTDGAANLLSVKAVLNRNSVDQQLYPRRGSDFTLSLQVTPPYSMWDGVDYSDTTLSDEERYKYIEFHKWTLSNTWYQGFLKNSNLVLMARAEMGFLGSFDKNKVSPFERFDLGGDGMSGYSYYGIDIVSLRGYDDGVLNPVGSDYSVAYNKYTVELRYPIMMNQSAQIYALTFMEAGNGFDSWRDFRPFNVKRSAGAGIRLYLPVVGMIGFDWGYGFDPASGESEASKGQFHFVMGQTF
ncbi:MAG: outer membrane protein assembly factor BamA [Rikenellaceae bacterium]